MEVEGEASRCPVELGKEAVKGGSRLAELTTELIGCALHGIGLTLVFGQGHDEVVNLVGVGSSSLSELDRHDGRPSHGPPAPASLAEPAGPGWQARLRPT